MFCITPKIVENRISVLVGVLLLFSKCIRLKLCNFSLKWNIKCYLEHQKSHRTFQYCFFSLLHQKRWRFGYLVLDILELVQVRQSFGCSGTKWVHWALFGLGMMAMKFRNICSRKWNGQSGLDGENWESRNNLIILKLFAIFRILKNSSIFHFISS